jgi:GPI mannosyltransferase 3
MKNLSIKKIALVSLFFHILAAVFSTGFHHFDEHFQIYEFLNFKLGNIPSGDLAWEYREKIRPWFQIFNYWVIHQGLSAVGVSSPFVMAFFFRLATSLFGWGALVSLYPVIRYWFKEVKFQKLAWAMVHLSWFIPYIQVRTSSESFGISFFLLGFSLFMNCVHNQKHSAWDSFLAGIFFGLSYLSRFQMALPIAFLWFWAVSFRRDLARDLFQFAIAIVLIIGVGFVYDFWGYGVWSFSLWHYFRTNFLEGIMGSVQQYPWYWYLRWSFLRGIPPVALPLILATLWGWWRYRKHPLTWITFPLFAFHSWVGHKELRYIYPAIVVCPFYLVYWLQDHREKVEVLWQKRWVRGLTKFVIGVNFLFLFISSMRPANPSVKFYQYLYNHPEIKEIYALHESPYTMLGLPISFYKPSYLKDYVLKDENEISFEKGQYFFFNRGHHIIKWEKDERCQIKFMAYPRWSLNYNIGNWLSRSRVWSLFYCHSK